MVRHIRLADQGTGLETAVEPSVRLIEVLIVEAYHHIEGSKWKVFQGIHQGLGRLGDCILAEIRRSQLWRVLCLYPTIIESANVK